ncbi:Zinc finger MYM-type protein 1 [Dissostichus eleginoides]|uniref:Zinc finger MYM-type protein 1 n=1 Tax=Dissostichus eleginoides TaxID=100907 RepID=A0AAD9CNG3_DISEL|nr:Zinc finger MYM-type protein 1 [Dissostichus eleginoides]
MMRVMRESANRGNYLELLTFLAEYDPDLHYHLFTSKVFIGTSSQIQNDLISAVAEVMGENIKEEISKAPFVALMLDETSDGQAAMALGFLKEHGCMDKLVAQCYDDAAVMASWLNGVQAKVKEKIPQALFIHWEQRQGGQNERQGGQNERQGGQNERPGGQNERQGGQNERQGGQNERPGGQNERPSATKTFSSNGNDKVHNSILYSNLIR